MKSPTDPDNVEDHNRVMIAAVASVAILILFQLFIAPRLAPPKPKAVAVAAEKTETIALRARNVVLAEGKRLPIAGKKLSGSLSLKGGRLDDIILNEHFTTVARTTQQPLFTPSGVEGAFYAESGWVKTKAEDSLAVPTQDTVWTLQPGSPATLTSGSVPVRLMWDNGKGVVFTREIALDDAYLFTITAGVTNKTTSSIRLNPYALTTRHGYPPGYSGMYTLHEGPVARFNGELQEPQYKKLLSGKKVDAEGAHGWLGITDKYWMGVFLPPPDEAFTARIAAEAGSLPHFQADLVGSTVEVASGQTVMKKTYLYAGAKVPEVMKAYQTQYGFDRLEDSIDFGMWFFITKPFYTLFRFLVETIGNVGLSVLALTIIVRGATFPLASKAYVSMAKMKILQPKMKELQEKYKGDRMEMQKHLIELYQKENANPFSGCLPMVVQIPIFFALYKVILISVDLRHAPFWGWIHDLSAPDPTSVFNLFGLIPWIPPQPLMIGAWPLLFCATMVIQKRLAPPMTDPVQEKIQSYFPFIVTVMMAHFASGLVIYWTWSNMLAILQQYYISTRVGDEKVSLLRGHHSRHKPRAVKKKK